ncbi:DUF1330 domain-containing protein [Paracoccus seriniphilus]|uniref:Uncharacterized conserved protein, DUF1330 family n=1 Tax=Paracoccus seriniphilus TaxID=184748 RepID=A0A239PVH6_9RHOB|nr:DUF1330 domain-containing protein [Paracoccus seriniphilus]WCR15450.1 DUF1330 domain-containing protein [Paracoccus seriniphilus]SNT73942.1 Uncharacterized conserved protein, DUF1330 family [Paracoccus seriniphilus]
MTAYSVLFVTPTEDSWVPAYLAETGAVMKKHGGRYLARTGNHQQIEGADIPAGLRILIEWPSQQDALNFENDPEYKPHLEARLKGSTSYHFVFEGQDDLA